MVSTSIIHGCVVVTSLGLGFWGFSPEYFDGSIITIIITIKMFKNSVWFEFPITTHHLCYAVFTDKFSWPKWTAQYTELGISRYYKKPHRGGQLKSSRSSLVSHFFSIPSKHSWLIKLNSKLKIMIRWLLESGVLAGAGEKLWHQSGPQGLQMPTPAEWRGACRDLSKFHNAVDHSRPLTSPPTPTVPVRCQCHHSAKRLSESAA